MRRNSIVSGVFAYSQKNRFLVKKVILSQPQGKNRFPPDFFRFPRRFHDGTLVKDPVLALVSDHVGVADLLAVPLSRTRLCCQFGGSLGGCWEQSLLLGC